MQGPPPVQSDAPAVALAPGGFLPAATGMSSAPRLADITAGSWRSCTSRPTGPQAGDSAEAPIPPKELHQPGEQAHCGSTPWIGRPPLPARLDSASSFWPTPSLRSPHHHSPLAWSGQSRPHPAQPRFPAATAKAVFRLVSSILSSSPLFFISRRLRISSAQSCPRLLPPHTLTRVVSRRLSHPPEPSSSHRAVLFHRRLLSPVGILCAGKCLSRCLSHESRLGARHVSASLPRAAFFNSFSSASTRQSRFSLQNVCSNSLCAARQQVKPLCRRVGDYGTN